MASAPIREAFNALGTANILRRLTLEQQRSLLDLFTRSAGEMLDERFESDLVKALYGFDAIVGNYASPYAAGSAYVMLHHAFGEVNGKKGVWGHAIGGMGAITQAMAAPRAAMAPTSDLDAGVREVIVERDRAVGVILDNGKTIRARYVASSVNPKLLYTRLVPADALPAAFLDRIGNWRNGSGTFRMNVALSALPSFTALPGAGDHLTRRHHHRPQPRLHGPRLAGRARPRLEPQAGGRGADPLDPGRYAVPAGPACRQPVLPACRAAIADRPIVGRPSRGSRRSHDRDRGRSMRPGFAASVIGRQILSPLDLERQFGLLGGDIFHGALTLNQLFSARPMLGHADYRGPLQGPLPLRLRRPSRRRRHRRPRPQRRARDPEGSPGAVRLKRRPDVNPRHNQWTGCG